MLNKHVISFIMYGQHATSSHLSNEMSLRSKIINESSNDKRNVKLYFFTRD